MFFNKKQINVGLSLAAAGFFLTTTTTTGGVVEAAIGSSNSGSRLHRKTFLLPDDDKDEPVCCVEEYPCLPTYFVRPSPELFLDEGSPFRQVAYLSSAFDSISYVTQIGTVSGYCVRFGGQDGRYECNYTVVTPIGRLMLQGQTVTDFICLNTEPPRDPANCCSPLAISGGTGEYSGITGSALHCWTPRDGFSLSFEGIPGCEPPECPIKY